VRQDPFLSIVVCTLGTAAVEETVASVRASAAAADAAVECVVVWQGDATPPELGEGVVVVEAFPLGLSHARNRGLAVARAPIVGFVDDDELVDEGWVRAAIAAFGDTPRPAAAFGPVAPLDERGLPYCHLEPGVARVFAGASTPPWTVGTGGNMVFDRDELLAAGGFDVLLGAGAEGCSAEETDVIMRLLRRGRRIAWAPELGVYHPTKDEAEHLAMRFPYAFGLGRALRKHRDVLHLLRYLRSIRDVRRTGDARRRREAGITFKGLAAGLLRPVDRRSPARALEWMPPEALGRLGTEGWEPLPMHAGPPVRLAFRRAAEVLEVWIGPDSDDSGAPADAVESFSGRDSVWLLRAS
jgi:hypothetical protein